MLAEEQLISIAKYVDPVSAKDYAKSRGWESLETKRPVFLLKHPEQPLRQLQIPVDTEMEDYPLAIIEVAKRLEGIEGRSIDRILEDLVEPTSDVLRQRTISRSTRLGSMQLDSCIGQLEGVRKALLASACTVVEPRVHHPRLSRSDAVAFVKACRVGQTEVGSFVFKMICPLDVVEGGQQVFDGIKEPFARRATKLFMGSVSRLVHAIDHDQVERLVESNAVDQRISDNFLDGLLLMRSDELEARVDVSFQWAPTCPLPDAASIPSVVSLRPHHFKEIERIYSVIRSQAPQEAKTTFVGTVEELRGDIDDDGCRYGTVVLRVMHEDELIRASVFLTHEDHMKAVDAYETNRQVFLKGKLQRTARQGRVVDPEDFRVLD